MPCRSESAFANGYEAAKQSEKVRLRLEFLKHVIWDLWVKVHHIWVLREFFGSKPTIKEVVERYIVSNQKERASLGEAKGLEICVC